MSTLVKNQHYVWRNYLKPWTEKSKLYCLRQRENKLFGTNVSGIASETFFYRVERLSPDDLKYLKGIIDLNVSPEMRAVHNDTIQLFQFPFTLRDQFKSVSGGRKISKKLDKLLEDAEKTVGEHYHTMTEQKAAAILEQLKSEDCSFFQSDESALEFAHFISHQFFRTPKLKDLNSKLLSPYPGLDLKRTWFFQSHIFADNIASSIFVDKVRYRFIFLRNRTAVPFMTSDQPVFNMHNPQNKKELRLYYPLSPALAMIFFDDDESAFKTVSELTVHGVEYYNQVSFNRSYDQLYSNDKEYLSKFKLMDKSIAGLGSEKA